MHYRYIAEFYFPRPLVSSFISTQRVPLESNSALLLFKVIKGHEIDTNLKSICDILLVFHCNYIDMFYPLRDITFFRRSLV